MNNIDKIYGLCINSERRKNLEKYEKIFNIKIDTTLSHNAMGKNLNDYIKNNQVVSDWPHPSGAIGCTLSFFNIYKHIVDNNYNYSIIFEDDIDWYSEHYGNLTKENFEKEIAKIDFDGSWDIFYLGTESRGEKKNQKHIKDNIYELESGRITEPIKNKSYKALKISNQSNPRLRHNNFGGQQAFILSLKGARELLKYHEPAYCISDGLVSHCIMKGEIINRAFIPTLFTQISHPRTSEFENKLWASQTGIHVHKTNEKYDENMSKKKKGCSEFPIV